MGVKGWLQEEKMDRRQKGDIGHVSDIKPDWAVKGHVLDIEMLEII